MPASLPPSLTFYTVVGDTETLTELLDFGTGDAIDADAELGPVRVRIYNGTDVATALNPICYVGGTDASVVGEPDKEWIYIKNIDNNGVPVIDDPYEPISHLGTHTYKPLAGSDIAPETYITFDTTLTVPVDTPGGRYEWDYIIEYMYTT